ncbi:MAG: polyprenyl synthetase family protein [Chloroflexota bacterium]|nr:polyprenyl synthetase family protein [Chloroflexota bacterium]
MPTVLPKIFLKYRASIDNALRTELSENSNPVYNMLRYNMGWVDLDGIPTDGKEGKALRPTLCLFACEAVGGFNRQAMPTAVALELIHCFSLIHDDIQDKDEFRHHRPTLWTVWGVPKALTAGNILRMVADMALEKLRSEGIASDISLQGVQMLTDAYLSMIEGQYLDLFYEGRHDISIPQYLDMISRKTGALIRCSTTIGAFIGNQDKQAVASMGRFGMSLGYIFQIRDDILGVWGDEQNTGKPVGADIKRKKNSLPIVYSMSTIQGIDRQTLHDIYDGNNLSNEQVSTVLEIMARSKVLEYAKSLAELHAEAALKELSLMNIDRKTRSEARELVYFLLERDH